ncbi:MAG: methyltransferase domain-containing protein [Gammaproteobacteria bacterium]
MTKYFFTATALKLFSLNPLTKSFYRKLGNSRFGGGRRHRLNPIYVERGNWLLDRLERLQIPARQDIRCLELGTGWVHFFSIYLRLFMEFKVTLFDVWDNRQLGALKKNFSQVPDVLTTLGTVDAATCSEIKAVVDKIVNVQDFTQLYELLGLDYQIDPRGSMNALPSNFYDLVFSIDVLEHVNSKYLQQSITEYYRVLKPGGYSIHQIGVDDHLTHYSQSASKKQYLAYSDSTWSRWFENDVQYFNRISFDAFRRMFSSAGFEEIEVFAEPDPGALATIRIATQYKTQSIESLEAVRVYLIHRKPLGP